ncbi:ImmA/IrrE family metallo-endopeptidase [Filobacillus milosensis]|uniref:ImmA/IrrE family metallo-endopeptidase n=1 Tax=Filobacillus milosensis TaxID=94137 RepID=A0A4Y8IK73_9BACI|nr:ImmA/IrrE family metallo-endopeptidase [Filobacillus milosensis]TFB21402.1 ImmA/IrrE family metallo-endopeptidase [Filobacillus milosensis]
MKLENVERKAYELLQKFELKTIPIDVKSIAKRLGISIKAEPLKGDISGVLYIDNNKTIIGLNDNHSDTRHRFTIAHEIGHFVLHEGEQIHVDRNFRGYFRNSLSSQAIDYEEIEASTFTAALLMPGEVLKKAIFKDGIDLESDDNIQELANKFNVSQQALLIRLGKLSLY